MARFNPPGNAMPSIVKMENQHVLLARNTQQYDSGPSVSFCIGYVIINDDNEEYEVFIQGTDPHQQPAEKFQRWWPMPEIKLNKQEKLADKRKK